MTGETGSMRLTDEQPWFFPESSGSSPTIGAAFSRVDRRPEVGDNRTLGSVDVTSPSSSSSASASASSPPYEPWEVALIAVACGVIVVGTIVGNILVCTAVAIVRRLRTPSNLLIVSLAVSDLLVAALVMPFATMYEVMGRWELGQAACDMWTSLDVLLCTASILNLCAISVDRYFVITRPFQYAMKRTPVRMALMILAVWVLSALISIPPLFGWKVDARPGQCMLSQEIGYQFYATIGAFYLPLGVMIVIYTRIYLVSSRIAHAEARSKPIVATSGVASSHQQLPVGANCESASIPLRKESSPTAAVAVDQYNGHGAAGIYHPPSKSTGRDGGSASGNELLIASTSSTAGGGAERRRRRFRFFGKSRLNRISSSNERKATKTLGVIMGAFSACWLPFFILALIKPFCHHPDSCIPHWLNGLFLWLGYANSFLNPIIYARFNRDFRTPFKHILQCHVRDINSRLRTENYAEQFGREMAGAVMSGGGRSTAFCADQIGPPSTYSAPPSTVPRASSSAAGHDGVIAARYQCHSGVKLTT